MPYIKKEDRDYYISTLAWLSNYLEDHNHQPGHYNFVFYQLLTWWFRSQPRYNTANAIAGVLECVKQEFYRKQVAPYEEEKIKENGDI